ncbi:hypothetical protein KJ656_06275, partial [bacterium]|nr:hypothetical protein [bacterium]
ENLKEIIKTLKEEKQDKDLGHAFDVNKEAAKHLLLIPVYRESDKIFAEEKDIQKYPISNEDFVLADALFKYLGEKVILARYECDTKVLKKVGESIGEPEKYYDFSEERTIAEPELLLGGMFDYFSVRSSEFDKFKKLDNEIVHFRKVKFSAGEKFNKILDDLRKVKNYSQKESVLEQLQLDFEDHKDIKKYTADIQRIEQNYVKEKYLEFNNKKLKIKYLANHYYIPLIVSESLKVDYLSHIIEVESEVKFIEKLEKYLQSDSHVFVQFDWWMFSKLDETLDEVYIPYYNPKNNNMAKFKPDFIFWMQKGNDYTILFVDPKGTEHADGYRKIDGYSRIFETAGEKKENKVYLFNGFNIRTKLLLTPAHGGVAGVPEPQRKYWFDNFTDFANKI